MAVTAKLDAGADAAFADAQSATALLAARPYASNLHVPATYDPAKPTPLVVMLHGYGTDGQTEEAYYFHLTTTSDANGFLYVYPNGTVDTYGSRFWNATDACCNFFGSTVDDVAYLNAVIEDIKTRYSVDSKRVFVGGHSNGGFMAHRFACDSASQVAAIVSYAGAQWNDPDRCQPSEPVSAVEMHGDDDVLTSANPYPIQYDGGANSQGVPFPAAPTTVATWAAKDGCTGKLTASGQTFDFVSALPGNETRVAVTTECPAGIDAELWTIQGGGHMDPLNEPAWGDALWSFFSAHPKR
jgi:polyhydroxybutyrate depolymerase